MLVHRLITKTENVQNSSLLMILIYRSTLFKLVSRCVVRYIEYVGQALSGSCLRTTRRVWMYGDSYWSYQDVPVLYQLEGQISAIDSFSACLWDQDLSIAWKCRMLDSLGFHILIHCLPLFHAHLKLCTLFIFLNNLILVTFHYPQSIQCSIRITV